MSAFEFYLFAHVLAAVVWVGGGVIVQIFGAKFSSAQDPKLMAAFGETAEKVGQRVFMPASILTLLFGILLVTETGFEFSDPFVVYGIAAIAISAITGAAYLGPESGKLGVLMTEEGTDGPRGPEPDEEAHHDLEDRAVDPARRGLHDDRQAGYVEPFDVVAQ